MKATVNTKLLQEALEFVVAEKGSLPIIDKTVAIRAKGDSVIVESNDLEMIMQATIPAVVNEEGGAVVSKAMLKHYISGSGDTVLHCREKDNVRPKDKKKDAKPEVAGRLHVSTEESQGWIEDRGIEQYPVWKDAKWKKFAAFDGEAVDHLANCVTPFSARSSLRPVLSGMHLTQRVACCTDSYRLCEFVHDSKAKEADAYIVPVKPFPLIHKHAKSVNVLVEKGKQFVRYELGDLRVTDSPIEKVIMTRVIEGKFPTYRPVLLKKTEIKAVLLVDREAMLKAIKRLHPVAKDVNNNVTYLVKKGEKTMTMRSKHHSAAMEVIVKLPEPAADDIRIALSSVYVTTVMEALSTKNVEFEFQDAVHPAQFRMPDDRKTTVIVMPLRMQED